ncbi:MAG: SPFH domain-containing protein [Chloroflexota bacterium]|nr:SPFH domain-containing protein [Chloroflexota bacterium]
MNTVKREQRNRRMVAVTVVIVIIFGVSLVGLTYTPVEHGTVALVRRFGGLTGETFEPGLHWRIPFIDQVVVVSTVVQSYETSDDPGASRADYRDYPVTAQTIDGQQISIKYTVLFRVPPEQAVNIVQNIGRLPEVVENVVKAHSRNLTRMWAQSHTAEDLYSGEGIFAYQSAVQDALEQEFEKYGVFLDDFLVRKIDFDADYIAAIEQQQIAQEAIETAKYQADAAEYEKERQIRLAEADAERVKLLAEADAERQRLLADSEAYSIQARGETLQKFPEVVQWEFVRNLQNIQWGILPSEGLTPLVPIPSFEDQETVPAPLELPGESD